MGKVTQFRYFFCFKKLEKIFEKPLTNRLEWCIIIYVAERCDTEKNDGSLAQLGEHLPYKQRVIGSSPIGPIYRENGFYLCSTPMWLNSRQLRSEASQL